MGPGRRLQYIKGGEPAVGVERERRPQGVRASGLQPLRRPGGQVPARGLLQGAEQVGERRAAPLVGVEVVLGAGEELLRTDPRDQLLDHGGALGVGDAVEVDRHVLQVADVRDDRVRGGQLVLPQGHGLVAGRERGPGRPAGDLGHAADRDVRRERLLQPEVIPPPHGDQVAEPHVRQLVQDCLGAILIGGISHLRAEHVVLVDGHAGDVLHRADVVLRDEDLVVLLERVPLAEPLDVVVEALPGDVEDRLGVEIAGHRRAAGHRHRDHLTVRRGVHIADDVVLPGDDRGDVGRDRRRRREPPGAGARAGLLRLRGRGVRQHRPAGRRGDRERERCLQVRLLECRVEAARVRHLEMRVEVGPAVGGVDRAVQALPAVGVLAVSGDAQLVVGGQAVELDAAAGVRGRRVDRLAVQRDLAHSRGDEVHKRRGARLGGGEPDRGYRAERVAGCREIKVDEVGADGEQLAALTCLVAGQVESGHAERLRPIETPDHLARCQTGGPV